VVPEERLGYRIGIVTCSGTHVQSKLHTSQQSILRCDPQEILLRDGNGEVTQTGLVDDEHSTPGMLPTSPLSLILRLPIRQRLPLHVGRVIRPTTLQSPNVIDDIARTCSAASACGWTRMLPLEVIFGGGTPLDSSVAVALNPVS
jgi:hypothetical protein